MPTISRHHRRANCASPGKARLRISYVGQFYFNPLHEDPDGIIPWYKKKPHRWLHYYATRQRWIYRTPYFFFRAWARLRETNPELGDRLEFHYVGHLPEWLPEMAEAFGLAQLCTWHGLKPKQETQGILEGSDALLSTSIKVLDGEDYCLASKTFDYIAAGKPVLGFVCPGMQRDFLAGSSISVLFDPEDTEGSARKLGALVKNGVTLKVDLGYLETYSSLSTTCQLAEIVRQVIPRAGQAGLLTGQYPPREKGNCQCPRHKAPSRSHRGCRLHRAAASARDQGHRRQPPRAALDPLTSVGIMDLTL